MKRVILAIIVMLFLTGLFAQAGADHIQGKLYFWDEGEEDWVPAGSGYTIYVKLLDIYHEVVDTGDDVTDSNGFYSYNFSTTTGAEYVTAKYQSLTIEEEFDGIVRIDIYWDLIQPEPDPEPNND